MKESNNISVAICLFVALVLLGMVMMQVISIGTIEAGFIYLSATIGAGLFWIGSKIEKP